MLELKGFCRVRLAPRQTARVTFDLPVERVAFFDRSVRLVVEPGLIEVKVGASAGDIRAEGRFRLTGPAHPIGRRDEICRSHRPAPRRVLSLR